MIRILKKFSCLFDRRQKNRIYILFFMMLIGAFLEVIGVSLMLPIVSAIMNPNFIDNNNVAQFICALLDLHSYRTFLVVCVLALIVVFIGKDLFLMLQYYVQYRFIYNNRFATQKKLVNSYLQRPYEYFLNINSGEIMRVIQDDTVQAFGLLTSILSFCTESVVSLALVITIFVIDPLMTIFVAMIMVGTMIVIAYVIKPILRREGLALQKNSALSNKWLLQAINGIKEAKVSCTENFFEENFEIYGLKRIRAEKWNSVMSNIPRLLIEMVSVCSMLALVAFMIFKGLEIETLIPALGAFAMAAVKLMPSANRIIGAANAIAFQEPALDKLLENIKIFKTEELQVEEKKDVSNWGLSLNESVELKKIFYHYPNSKKNILEDVDMVIPIGKSVGIIGVSGAGKTTVVDILLGLLIPQKGDVLADGLAVSDSYQEWLSHIGYIPQMIFMLDDSICANIAFGYKEADIDETKVWRALEEAQLADFVRTLPEGIYTQIGERGVRLSGGQRQRIGIARALYKEPEILIFDEATSALDNETEAAIMESINSLHGKKTLVIIAHRLQTIEGCDIVYRARDGKILREK